MTAQENHRKGIITAAQHILEAETKLEIESPANAIIIVINAMPLEDQNKIKERLIAYLKEQIMLINQKPI